MCACKMNTRRLAAKSYTRLSSRFRTNSTATEWDNVLHGTQTQAAGWSTNLANSAGPTDLAAILWVISRPIIRTRGLRSAFVDRRIRGGTNVEFGELVKLDVDLVLRSAFTLSLDFFGLSSAVILDIQGHNK